MSNIEISSYQTYFKNFHPHSLYYSFNGVGKTTFAGKTGLRTVLLDCGDAGVMSLRGVDTVKMVKIKSSLQYLDVMEAVNRVSDKFDLLVVDTLTGLQSMAIKEVKGRRGEMNIKKWGSVSGRVIECISETRMFPKDVIYLAQEKKKGKLGEEDGPQLISPSLSPSVREFLSGCVDWVGRLYIEDGKRKVSFILSDTMEAKDRSSLFPKIIGNPSYLPIRKRILESVANG